MRPDQRCNLLVGPESVLPVRVIVEPRLLPGAVALKLVVGSLEPDLMQVLWDAVHGLTQTARLCTAQNQKKKKKKYSITYESQTILAHHDSDRVPLVHE